MTHSLMKFDLTNLLLNLRAREVVIGNVQQERKRDPRRSALSEIVSFGHGIHIPIS